MNWKLKAVSAFLFIVGLIYLILWLISIIQHKGGFDNTDPGKISISKAELISHVRSLLSAVSCLLGSLLLFRKRRIGWLLAVPVLFIFLVIALGGGYQAINTGGGAMVWVAACGLALMLLSIIILLLPSTRLALGLTRNHFIKASVLIAIYSIIYFL